MSTFNIGFNGTSTVAAELALYSSAKYTDESVVFSGKETDASYARNSHSNNFSSVLLDVFIAIGCGLIGIALLLKANKE